MNEPSKELFREASRFFGGIGGKTTLEKHGREHFKKIARISAAKRSKLTKKYEKRSTNIGSVSQQNKTIEKDAENGS